MSADLRCVYTKMRESAGMCMCVPVISGPSGHQVVQEEHPFPAPKWRSSDF